MSSLSVEKIREITTFKQLLAYLRDELDWPIEEIREEDLTFSWRPDEIGLDPKTTAKIREIKQLRPLVSNQTWGIFFVNFEPKKLPIVVLRRILGALVVKKRHSAAAADRRAWQMHDLLFIARHGEGDERELTFAHFQEDPDSGDLPVLRVLGWDGSDTPLKLEHIVATLHDRLRWPDNTENAEAWRQQWSSAFRHRPGHVIRTSDELAEVLAALARGIRDAALTVLSHETDRGPLRRLHKAFQTALIHDLSEAGFAGTYAQTITYGLLTAAITHTDMTRGRVGTILAAEHVADIVPVTNPFLKEMLQTFLKAGGRRGAIDFDELGVQEVVELLRGNQTDLPAILRDFGNRTRGEDPVIHFYEHFLAAYDKEEKVQRGVFYTPQPVVSYIVRSVHEVLKTEFRLEDGLASTVTWGEMANEHGFRMPVGVQKSDAFVQILDPATGTATFLVEVIDVIHRTLAAKWKEQHLTELQQRAEWNDYVPKHLLPRLYGYELMMAPYAIAHMKIGLKLYETGYRFGSDERARIYLTNALEPPQDFSDRLAFDAPALAHEAQAVNAIKRDLRFTVVIGNPPYAGHSKNNEIKSIVSLVKDFTRDDPSLQGPGQGKWLQDDYVKFLRLSQEILAPVPLALLAMITNHRYLTNRTFRGMRRQWVSCFLLSRILDLHGNNVVDEVSPLGHDENVFDIEQGVSIGVFVKTKRNSPDIAYAELWGNRTSPDGKGKYDFLSHHTVCSTSFNPLKPEPPNWLFAPRVEPGEDIRAEFEHGLKMQELMPGALGPNGKPQSGLATMHDGFALSFSEEEIEEKVKLFLRTSKREEAKEVFGTLCNPQQWDYAAAKKTLSSKTWREKISRIWFSPFDIRYTVYDKAVAVHLRRRLSDHLFKRKNLALVIGEAGQEISGNEWDAVSCVNGLLQLNYFRRNGSPTLPLYLYDDDLISRGSSSGRKINLSPT